MEEKNAKTWLLMSRCLSGEASAEEVAAFNELLAKDQELQQRYALVQAYWSTVDAVPEPGQHEQRMASIFSKSEPEEQPSPSFLPKKWLWVAAAVLTGLILIPVLLLVHHSPSPQVLAIRHTPDKSPHAKLVAAPAGSRMKTLLPDGSIVWLNADSRLIYNNDFTGSTREVTLEGEAYFDVKKNSHKPFIVHAGRINIKVLGTAFNVRSYATDKHIETTLLRGKIEITQPASPHTAAIILHPHEKLSVPTWPAAQHTEALREPLLSELKVLHIDSTLKDEKLTETAWLYNRLEFRDEDLETIARKMERWYNARFIFEDEAIKLKKFNGSFEKEGLTEALEALQKASPAFQFKITGNEVSVRSSQ